MLKLYPEIFCLVQFVLISSFPQLQVITVWFWSLTCSTRLKLNFDLLPKIIKGSSALFDLCSPSQCNWPAIGKPRELWTPKGYFPSPTGLHGCICFTDKPTIWVTVKDVLKSVVTGKLQLLWKVHINSMLEPILQTQ